MVYKYNTLYQSTIEQTGIKCLQLGKICYFSTFRCVAYPAYPAYRQGTGCCGFLAVGVYAAYGMGDSLQLAN